MIVVDTSALMTLVVGEADAEAIASSIKRASPPRMSAASYAEFQIVAMTRFPSRPDLALRTVTDLGIDVVPLTRAQADLAAEAYARYGKGRIRRR